MDVLAGCSTAVALAACSGSGGSASVNHNVRLVAPAAISTCLEQAGLHVVDGGPPADNNESAAPTNLHKAARHTAMDEVYLYVALSSAGEPPDATVEVLPNPQDASAVAARGGGSGYAVNAVSNIAWSEGTVSAAKIGADVRHCTH